MHVKQCKTWSAASFARKDSCVWPIIWQQRIFYMQYTNSGAFGFLCMVFYNVFNRFLLFRYHDVSGKFTSATCPFILTQASWKHECQEETATICKMLKRLRLKSIQLSRYIVCIISMLSHFNHIHIIGALAKTTSRLLRKVEIKISMRFCGVCSCYELFPLLGFK